MRTFRRECSVFKCLECCSYARNNVTFFGEKRRHSLLNVVDCSRQEVT